MQHVALQYDTTCGVAIRCNVSLQCDATCGIEIRCNMWRCNTMQHMAITMQHVAMKYDATCDDAIQCNIWRCSTMRHVTMQHDATCGFYFANGLLLVFIRERCMKNCFLSDCFHPTTTSFHFSFLIFLHSEKEIESPTLCKVAASKYSSNHNFSTA